MQKYELLLVLPGTFDEKESENEANKILTIVSEVGENASISELGKNRLAYPIKQIRYGYFYTIIFEAEAEKVKELKNKLNLDKNILRSFITKYNEKMSQAQKISYFDSEVKEGIKEKTEEVSKVEEEVAPATKEEVKLHTEQSSPVVEKIIDLKEIDKKLDEILADDNLMNKV